MHYQNINLHNVGDIEEETEHGGFTISRLPLAVLPQINEGARQRSLSSANAEIRGYLPPGGKARIVLQCLDTNVVPPIATVFFGTFRSQQVLLSNEPTTITIVEPDKMPLMEQIHARQPQRFNPRLVRVCLPHIHRVRVVAIEGDLTTPPAAALPAKTLLCYGSSITHGAHAVVPEGTYAAQCAHHLGYDLINLGFGGSAHMDAAVAAHIAGRPDWDVATLEMGINVRSWPVERFRAAVEQFVTTIVTAHPTKPIFCIDLFTNDNDYQDNPQTAVGFRECVATIVENLNSPHVRYVDGRTILTNPAGLQVDLVHPSDLGMIEMGRNLARVIAGSAVGSR